LLTIWIYVNSSKFGKKEIDIINIYNPNIT
jgi:hypothetical protein